MSCAWGLRTLYGFDGCRNLCMPLCTSSLLASHSANTARRPLSHLTASLAQLPTRDVGLHTHTHTHTGTHTHTHTHTHRHGRLPYWPSYALGTWGYARAHTHTTEFSVLKSAYKHAHGPRPWLQELRSWTLASVLYVCVTCVMCVMYPAYHTMRLRRARGLPPSCS